MSSSPTRDDDDIGTLFVVFGRSRSRYGAIVVSSEAERKTREENELCCVFVVKVVSDQEKKRRLL